MNAVERLIEYILNMSEQDCLKITKRLEGHNLADMDFDEVLSLFRGDQHGNNA